MFNEYESEGSWEKAVRRSNKPVCFNFLVMPVVPDDEGALLDPSGEPAYTDYRNIDWKGAAKAFQACLSERVPKSVKVYVANDGPDVSDINEFCAERPVNEEGKVNGFVYRVFDALKGTPMSHRRAGVLKLPADNGLHLNPPHSDHTRSPLTGMIVSLKFNSMFQAMDYFTSATRYLWGLPSALPPKPFSLLCGEETYGNLPEEVHTWLENEFGAVYSDKCGVLFLSCTFSD